MNEIIETVMEKVGNAVGICFLAIIKRVANIP